GERHRRGRTTPSRDHRGPELHARGQPREVGDEQQRVMGPPLRHVDPGESQLIRLHREPRDHIGSGLKRGERDANARPLRVDAAVAGISRHTAILGAAAAPDNRATTLVFPPSDPEISFNLKAAGTAILAAQPQGAAYQPELTASGAD